MAQLIKLRRETTSFESQYSQCQKNARSCRALDFKAALLIQRWYRGYKVRKAVKEMNKFAQLIQRSYRGFNGRKMFRWKVLCTFRAACVNLYVKSAIKIQSRFRGFISRKNILDFYKRRIYLAAVAEQNEIIRERLDMERKIKHIRDEIFRQKTIEKKRQDLINRTHHLLSTKNIQGVYAERYEVEDELRKSVAGLTLRQKTLKATPEEIPAAKLTLPKVKGPFRTPEAIELLQTRNRKTVLISDPHKSEAHLRREWDSRERSKDIGEHYIHRGNPQPRLFGQGHFSRGINADIPYTTHWGRGYGVATFRESKEPKTHFHTAVKGIPIFEELQYS